MSHNRARITALTVLGLALLVVSGAILGSHYLGQGRAERTLSSAPLPSGLGPSSTPVPSKSATPSSPAAPRVVADKPGTPVKIIVAGHQVRTAISADPLNADGSLFVPPDPRAVSWANQDVGPGSSYGTTILVGHVNFGGVKGVFSDLAEYRVGQAITVVLADGRNLKYAVVAPPREVSKDKVGPRRQELFDQTHSYGLAGKVKSGRLLLLSCGGTFDNRTGHYESNIFVYALPV